MNKIKQTPPDKVHGKLVNYRQGDCLSIYYNGKYLAAFISEKFNKFYDFTLIEFHSPNKPKIDDFISGNFFGTRFGSWQDINYAVDKAMINCKYIDGSTDIEKIGVVRLSPTLTKASYAYFNTVQELHNYYLEELPVRIEKSKNAEKFPDLAFASKHLVKMKHIVV